jgi:hypothetical protein
MSARKMHRKTLIIQYTSTPSSSPTRWHPWAEGGEVPEQHPNEDVLGWPAGTIAFLENGYAQNLTRDQGWDGSLIPENQREALRYAAKVYLRGVTYSDNVEFEAPEAPQQPYSVEISDSLGFPDDCFFICDGHAKQWFKRKPDYVFTSPSEDAKSLGTAGKILQAWRRSRKSHWVIAGGGITLDTGAFAAWIAGCPYTSIPTTL